MNDQIAPLDVEDPILEDFETQLNKVADQISELSNIEVCPVGYKNFHDPFEASEVDFSSGSWLLRLLQVQAWLHLDAEINAKLAEQDPKGVAEAFFKAINAEFPSECIRTIDGNVTLRIL